MQAQGHENGAGTELEHYDGEEAPTGQHRDKDLSRYDDDDVATAPWPPQLS